MSLEEYQKVSINKFMGLYQRGLTDECPPDHSPVCNNMKFNKNGETMTRDGTELSLTTGHKNVRMFVASFTHEDTGIMLTCDGAGHIYRGDTGGVLLTVANMVDFAAINIFSYCLISPILSSPTSNNPVYIWQGVPGGSDTVPIRAAAGPGPGTGMTGVENSIAGNCDIGVHQFGVSWITNTGYTTQPGPMGTPPFESTFAPVLVTSTGSKTIQLSNIPLGPSGTTERQILATQADQTLFFYAGGQIWNGSALIPWNGVIPDNTTTTIIISFFDTDLAVSADSLFDLLPVIPAGTFSLIAGITNYSGRVFYWGGEFNLVRVTNPGSAETIDNVAGFIQLPDKFDGATVVTVAITLQNSLYFMMRTGIYSVVDNGSDPNTWQIVTVDTGAGCTAALQIGSIDTSPATTQNQMALLMDYGGVYLFNGTVIQPPLTWKINDLWLTILATSNLAGGAIAIDPYYKLIFVAQLGNALGVPGYQAIIVGDYNDGLDPQNIKWSVYTVPYTIDSIAQAYFMDSSILTYRFRIGSSTAIYKLEPGALTDASTAISSTWSSYYVAPNPGALNIFRFIRMRMPFLDNVNITLNSQDNAISATPPGFTLPYVAGRDLTREFNFMDEKCAVQFSSTASNGGFTLQRLDIFCGTRFNMRPSV